MPYSPAPNRAAPDPTSLLGSLGDVASHINASGDLDTTLHHLLEAACRDTPWSGGGIMTIHETEGYARVVARHDPHLIGAIRSDRWLLAESPSRLALAENRPIVIPDAQKSRTFPGYRREALEHDYRTVVVLPMAYRDADERRTVLSVRSREVVKVTPAHLALLRFVVHLGDIAMNKARALADERAFGLRLREALTAHRLLLNHVLSDDSVEAAATKAMSLLPYPLVVVDLASRRVLCRQSPVPDVVDDAAWQAALAGETARSFIDLAQKGMPGGLPDTRDVNIVVGGRTIALPAVVCPLVIDRTQVGLLIVFSHANNFHDLDQMLIDSARFGLTVQMMRSHVAAAGAASIIDSLMVDLVGGKAGAGRDIARRAQRVGIDLNAPSRFIVVSVADGDAASVDAPELDRLIEHEVRHTDRDLVVAHISDAILVRFAAARLRQAEAERLMLRIVEAAAALGTGLIVTLSRSCQSPSDYAAAWEECSRVTSLAQRFGRRGVVQPEEFGPLLMLLPAVASGDVADYVERLVGPMVRHDRENGTAYVETLKTFLDNGARSQPCADALNLHVTTLRYRLGRIKQLFAVETDTADQRFALQTAFHLMGLVQLT